MTPGGEIGVAVEDLDLPELDIFSLEFEANPVEVLRELRSRGRIARSQRGVELLAHDLVVEAFNDRRLEAPYAADFLGRGAPPLAADFIEMGLMNFMERANHDRIRRVMGKAFRTQTIEDRREAMEETANSLIDGFAADGHCDFTWDFSHHYSIQVLCRLIGVPPEQVPAFGNATLDLVLMFREPIEPYEERIESALSTVRDYCTTLVGERRSESQSDFISLYIEVQEKEELISEDELVWGVADLLFAGHDTSRFQLASTVRVLIEQELWDEVAARPELIPAALDEAMRYYPIITAVSRKVIAPFEVDDLVLPPGTPVMLNMRAATRDPDHFTEPDRFDLDREVGRRVPFGHGLHKCLGHYLARTGMEVALAELTRRLKNPRIDGEIPELPAASQAFGPERLPLAFEPAESSSPVLA